MKTALPALLVLVATFFAALLPARPATGSAPRGHCAPAIVTPVEGDPGAYRIQTPHGTTIARRQTPRERSLAPGPIAEFRVFPLAFDADGDTLGTVHDTILVALGTTVRWVRRGPGFHTVTNGADSGDPNAAAEYNLIFDDLTNEVEVTFNTVGKHDFFCFIHEPIMEGTVMVTSATLDASAPAVLRRAMFTRPPSPNPTRGAISFAVAIPRASRVSLTVHDVAGRLVARVQDGPLPAGEHAFRWDGRGADGHVLESGRYFIALAAGDVRETRAVTLLR